MQDLLVENNIMQVPREKKTISWKVPVVISVSILFVIASVQIVTSNQNSSPAPTPSVSASKSAEPTPAPTESAVPSPAVTSKIGPVELTLVASRGNSYIDIIVDGAKIEKGSMFQGETKTFKGKKVISIYLSNPAGLDLTHNGKQLAPLGGQNEEVRRTFR
jgi:hypothetical protein